MPRAPRNAADEFACINVGNHYKGDSCVLCHHRAVCVRDGPSKDWRHRGVDVLIFGALQWNMEVSNEHLQDQSGMRQKHATACDTSECYDLC
jgi:hypothetical protein